MRRTVVTLIALLAIAASATAQPAASLAERTKGLTRTDGFVPFYWDAARGRLLLEVPAFDTDVLYYVSIAQGAGSVEMSLDRGIVGTAVIHFVRAGGRVLVEQQNLDYRVINGTPAMQENVRDSFATSVLAALPVEAEEGGRVLVDGTPLFMRDAAGVEGRLRQANQGAFRLDVGRSAFHLARTGAFPRNTEVETVVTFGAEQAGLLVNNVTPDGRSFTIRIHHSFLQAPEGYTPRPADPRIGVSAVRFRDYGRPFNESTEVAWVSRFRLQKKDPGAAMSEPVAPIVFYLDLGIPEPTRTAMREGALWWNRAFEAAGYRNAVQVRDPTPDMDPMDIRYPWILWINRDERGFSSGGTYRDPRTGEILGSKTRMDSHRIRTIGNYWESYTPTTEGAGGDECALFLPVPDFLVDQAQPPDHAGASPGGLNEMVLLRQALLTAHELGHVFGFGHNWASSANDRASVMEYPTPRVKVRADGTLDLSESFEEGTGVYDAFMARYAYTEFPAGQEAAGLDAIIREMRAKNVLYTPSTDPRWAWYDDRNGPTEYLRETMAARRIMLNRYGPAILQPGEPIGALRDLRLWMVYLHHRWAIEAGARYVGGQYHNIAVKGESLPPTAPVPAALQREVLGLLMEALDPANLAMPEALLAQLTPDPGSNREDMSEDYLFDHLRAARILSALVLGDLLEPARAARLVALSDRDPSTVSLQEVVAAVVDRTWSAPPDADARHRALRRVTERVALDALMMLGAHRDATPEVRAFVLDRLSQLEAQLRAGPHDPEPLTAAHQRQAARDLARYLENPSANAPTALAPNWGARPRSRFPLHPGPPLGGDIQ
ncbi:MAG: zinc-dependent metalloprotease [Vicinamibacterales bacterium]|nr:zinc-dependent metalloprotease [Vicinamibacterales bacterium]